MANLNGFDANQVEPNVGFEPVPAAKYIAMVTASEMKPTKNGDGSYLELELTILEGPFKDRKVWDRLCLNHPNAQTVKIARGYLSAICRATGVMQPKDSCELHNIPMCITVKCKKRDDNDEITNEIRGYAKKESVAGKPQQAAPTDNTPPWKR
ncbi:MAG TPA: DUF669 domain-containing protein [Anaerohalosphaeraceae bacterium]|nr:DUF669 domain-containing protein [Anaerohalosphaeraceae bacterium]HOM77479.1 DUF669 domain-containing protein [Anaerohalosphaeraceae bacterium]HRS72759.1 DUF669 domain-containing protein [Anaerohalosphaeraceae bacterium]HRV19818.1 DUF669 domain-containing protein [Anaerohalosphaeraceae bacterium]